MKPRTKKVLAEIAASIIPGQMERNRWRGILRYGPLRAIRLKRELKRNTTAQVYYLAICAIAKNEGPYFEEWIAWHRAHGVEKFYIYDNESTDDTARILAPYVEEGIVEYNFWPGARQQIPAYDDCIERHRYETRWMVFLDLDEFIIPVKDKTIPQYLKRFEEYPVVEVNWLIYGSGGEREKRPGGVMERFKYHSEPGHVLNRHAKSFVDPRRVCCMTGVHEAARLPGTGYSVNSNGERIRKNLFFREPVQDAIRINHYTVKSYEEFLGKRARGRARTLTQRGLDYFNEFDLNDIKDE